MIEIYAAPDLQAQADAIAADLTAAYPGFFEVATLSQGAAPFLHRVGQPAWDDLLILLFGGDTLPPHLQAPIQREIDAATRDKRACRVLPIATQADRPIPPAPLNQVKALPCPGSGNNDRERIVRRVGALLGLWLRGDHRKIFVSHRQSDGKALAAQVAQHLKENGYNAWLDAERLKGGEIVQQEIENHVADAHLLLLLDTPQAKDSEWIWKEVDAAIHGFVPILDLLLRPAGAESARSDFLALNELHHQSIQVSLSPDGNCKRLSKEALAGLLAAAEDYMVRILRLQMSLAAKAEETFTKTGFDWKVLDDRRKFYLSTKADDFCAQNRILSHCSAVSPTFHRSVRAFQAAPIDDLPCNVRLFLHEQPLARPLLERLTKEHGFRDDSSLRILDIAGLAKFLGLFRAAEEV